MKNLGKLSLAALLVSAACGASAGELYSGDKGAVSLSGDVEHDIYYTSKEGAVPGGQDEAKQNGRIKLEIAGERVLDNGYFAEFDVELLAKSDSEQTGTDNAYFKFGMQDAWDVTTGRYEAYDMFPKGQDTFMNDASIYQLKYARGRSTDGAVMVNGYVGNFTAQLNVQAAKAEDITLTGSALKAEADQESQNPIWVRPVLAYSAGAVTVAAGMETAVNVEDAPKGYALRFSYDADSVSVNAAAARLGFDGKNSTGADLDYTNTSLTLNATIDALGLGLFHTRVDDDKNVQDDYKQTQAYVSYKISNVLGLDNFEMYPAAYMMKTKLDGASDVKEGGLKLRLKYYF